MKSHEFAKIHGTEIGFQTGFPTLELANQYSALRRAEWGDNLVCLAPEEIDGLFYPQFNLFD